MKTSMSILLLICILFTSSGCATIFSGGREEINLTSEPEGAKVLVNGNVEGTTPMKLDAKKGNEYKIEFIKEGYESKTFRLMYSLGAGWLILDILSGLLGVIIDASTGNWNVFDQDNYEAKLEQKK